MRTAGSDQSSVLMPNAFSSALVTVGGTWPLRIFVITSSATARASFRDAKPLRPA